MENPIKMDDLGGPLFLETPIWLMIMMRISWKYHLPRFLFFCWIAHCDTPIPEVLKIIWQIPMPGFFPSKQRFRRGNNTWINGFFLFRMEFPNLGFRPNFQGCDCQRVFLGRVSAGRLKILPNPILAVGAKLLCQFFSRATNISHGKRKFSFKRPLGEDMFVPRRVSLQYFEDGLYSSSFLLILTVW